MRRKQGEDPVTFRVEYSLLVQQLHALTVTEQSELPAERPLMSDATVATAVEATQRLVHAQGEGAARERVDDLMRPLVEDDVDPSQALALVERSVHTLRRLGWAWVGSRPPWYRRWFPRRQSGGDRLGEFLDRVVEPAAVVVYFSCRVERGDWNPERFLDRRLPKRMLKRQRFARRWHRNRAQWLDHYLDVLRQPRPPRPSRPYRFVAWLGFTRFRPAPRTGYRVRYNLACLYSRLALRAQAGIKTVDETERFDYVRAFAGEAATHLSLCLAEARLAERETIAQWAWSDPALTMLRLVDEDGFAAIVGPRASTEPAQ